MGPRVPLAEALARRGSYVRDGVPRELVVAAVRDAKAARIAAFGRFARVVWRLVEKALRGRPSAPPRRAVSI